VLSTTDGRRLFITLGVQLCVGRDRGDAARRAVLLCQLRLVFAVHQTRLTDEHVDGNSLLKGMSPPAGAAEQEGLGAEPPLLKVGAGLISKIALPLFVSQKYFAGPVLEP